MKQNRLKFAFGVAFTIIFSGFICNGLPKSQEPTKSVVETIVQHTVQPVEVQKVEAREPIARELPRVETKLTGKYAAEFEKYFGYENGRIMQAICNSESQWNSWAVNDTLNKDKTWDVGLCQINVDVHGHMIDGTTKQEKVESLKNPEYNISIAKKVFDNRSKWDTNGFKAWSDYNNKKYLKYLVVDK